MSDRSIKLYGTNEAIPERRLLTAGSLTATFDDGQLRGIRIGGTEVIRGISFLVRERNWSTVPGRISNLTIDQSAGSFSITFDMRCSTVDGDFVWRGSYTGQADGTVTCHAIGRPDQDLVTMRTGFVILHPLQGVVGETMTVEHADGSIQTATVPQAIVPDQPFLQVRAMSHSPLPGLLATIRMEGDTWETEDHRNWTDASLKTYSRPLALPRPYTIPRGEEVRQSAILTFAGDLPGEPASAGGAVDVRLGSESGTMPQIGLSVLPEDAEAATAVARQLPKSLAHLNCRIDLRGENWDRPLSAYRSLAETAGAKIVLEIILADGEDADGQLDRAAGAVRKAGLPLSAVIATPAADLVSYPPGTPAPAHVPGYEAVAQAARTAFPGIRIGGGMLSNFTELNRNRPPRDVFDFISHATSSLVHAADDRSVMETIETIGHIIRSTQSLIGATPYRLGPSHIGNSFNPYGSQVTANPENIRITMARVEPRHRGLFGAAWHLGFIATAAEGGVEAVTMASPVGEFGLLYRKQDYSQPWFDTAPGASVYPVYHVIAAMAEAAGKARLDCVSSDPARVSAMAWREGPVTSICLANLTDVTVDVSLPAIGDVAVLDEDAFERAVTERDFLQSGPTVRAAQVSLKAYGIARITLGS